MNKGEQRCADKEVSDCCDLYLDIAKAVILVL